MPAQIGYFDTLKSVAGKVFNYLASITITGTDGKILTLTGDATISETPPLNANVVKGDGIVGRVLRVINLNVENGTEADHVKCKTTWALENISKNNKLDKLFQPLFIL